MMSAATATELRAITLLARGCEKSHGKKQTALLFSVLADRIEALLATNQGDTERRRPTATASALAA